MEAKTRWVCAAAVVVILWAAVAMAEAPQWPQLSKWKSQGDGKRDAAVIAAVEKYMFVAPVPGARVNAESWFEYLTQGRGIPVERVKLLRDEKVTAEKLRKYAADAAERVGEGGTLWFVFIGHGAPAKDGKDGILVGADAQQDADSLYARSLPKGELLQTLGKSKAGRVLAVLDACFSGKSAGGKPLVAGLQPLVVTQEALVSEPRAVVLTAAKGDELAGPLPGLGRPAFSYLVLGGLRGWADEDGNGAVTGQELVAYAGKVLRALVSDRSQTPTVEGGLAGVGLGEAWEKGPDLVALVKAHADAATEAPKVELTAVPELGGSLTGNVQLGADVDVLVAYDKAGAAEKSGTTAEKAKAWKALAALEGKNPYRADAEKRAAAWEEYARREEQLAEKAGEEWEKLQKLLPLRVVSAEQKKRLLAQFKSRFGALAVYRAKLDRLEGGSCPAGMAFVPGGTYTMMGERKDTVTVADFCMDVTEVTVDAYASCVAEGKCIDAGKQVSFKASHEVHQRCNANHRGRGNHPVNCIDWGQATAYCVARGKRLPSEEEWEWAARGGAEARIYPWGNDGPRGQLCWDGEGNDLGKGKRLGTCPVGSYEEGKSAHGIQDLAGNAWELTSSWHETNHTTHVLRGGAYVTYDANDVRAAFRGGLEPTYRSLEVGFRCARTQ
jgi:formylglycine-generating enzyme required for sulfatase activity